MKNLSLKCSPVARRGRKDIERVDLLNEQTRRIENKKRVEAGRKRREYTVRARSEHAGRRKRKRSQDFTGLLDFRDCDFRDFGEDGGLLGPILGSSTGGKGFTLSFRARTSLE